MNSERLLKNVKTTNMTKQMNSGEVQPTHEDEKSSEDPEESPLLPTLRREAMPPPLV